MFLKTGRKNCWQLAYPETAKELANLRSEAGEKLEAKAEAEFEREKLRAKMHADLQRTKRAQEKTKQVEVSSKQAEVSSTKQAEVDQMKCLLEAPDNKRASIMQSFTHEKTKQVEVEEKTKQTEATSSYKQVACKHVTKQMKCLLEAPNNERATIMQEFPNNHKEVSAPKKPRLLKRAKGVLKPLARLLPSRSLEEGEVSSLVSEGATADRYEFHNSHATVKVTLRGRKRRPTRRKSNPAEFTKQKVD